MSDFNLQEYAQAFLEEASELLEQANEDALKIENEPDDETLNSLFRSIHTIKGSAGSFGFDEITDFSHHLETLLDRLRSNQIAITSDIVDIILEGIDIIDDMVMSYKEGNSINLDTESYISKIKEILEDGNTNDKPKVTESAKENMNNNTFDCNVNEFSQKVNTWSKENQGDYEYFYFIKLNIDDDYLENGYDPISFIKNLKEKSDNVLVKAVIEKIPELNNFEPYKLYLDFKIFCYSNLGSEEIKNLFFEPGLVEVKTVGISDNNEKDVDSQSEYIDFSGIDKDAILELKESIEDYFNDIEPMLISIEKNKLAAIEDVNELFRVFHNIKGDAGYVGFKFLSEYAHHTESLLDKIRNKQVSFDDKAASIILKAIDDFNDIIDAAINDKKIKLPSNYYQVKNLSDLNISIPKESNDIEGIDIFLEQVNQFLEIISLSVSDENIDTKMLKRALEGLKNAAKYMKFEDLLKLIKEAEEKLSESDDAKALISKIKEYIENLNSPPKKLGEILIDEGLVTKNELEEVLEEQKPLGELLVEKGKVSKDEVEIALKKQEVMKQSVKRDYEFKTQDDHKKHTTSQTIKINQTKIDKFTNTIGEMIVAKNSYEYLVSRLATEFNLPANLIKEFKDNIYLISRISQDLQSDILSLRMVPIKQIFQKFNRVVRDISKKFNKEIDLITIGEDTEIDKNIADALNDPLIHIVRNSCDHGIETSEERLANNKPANGTLVLKAYQEGSFVYIEISDDGRGINSEKVLKKAIEKGLVGEDEKLTHDEIIKLIFEPGFSTAEKVTDVSGRGVGMDVVRTAIESVGGNIDIHSEEGLGTRITLRIPVNFGVSTTLLVEVNEEKYGIPIENIIETLKIPAGNIQNLHYGYGIYYRNSVLPIYYLSEILNEDKKDLGDEISIVVIKIDGYRFGLIVDTYNNIIDVAVKPVPKFLSNLSFIGGITILGSGKTVILLNPNKLLENIFV